MQASFEGGPDSIKVKNTQRPTAYPAILKTMSGDNNAVCYRNVISAGQLILFIKQDQICATVRQDSSDVKSDCCVTVCRCVH